MILPKKRTRTILEGDVPSTINPPAGCAFHPRCPDREQHTGCGIDNPQRINISEEHFMYCLPFKKEKVKYEGKNYISD